MSFALMARLWVMVFLHYFVWGAWYATMSTYLGKTLKFSGGQIGLAYGTTAIGAMVSPFLAGIVADRFFATQRILSFLHLAGAALLFALSGMIEFKSFYPMLIVYTITYMAGHGLTSSLTLHHATNPARQFPLVMSGGSVGWIAAGLAVSALKFDDSAGIFQLAAGAALAMGLYSLTLPHTPPKGAGAVSLRSALGLDALKLAREPAFAVFLICSFLVCVPLSAYFSFMSSFMDSLGIEHVAAKMTIAQVSDVVFLALLPVLSPRLGVKGVFLLGMLAWAARFGLLAAFDTNRDATWMLYLAIAVHGMCYDFIFVVGRMYVDGKASEEIRGAAQGLHAFVTLGAGMFVGTWLSGKIAERYSTPVGDVVTRQWNMIWMIPAGMAAVLLVAFALFFHDRKDTSAPAAAASES